ncbi:MAG: hypothetical protein IMX01_01580 [Limnochordaceae bacterium]|nr:hypothetical protein [Limnochordaceae bacterium]
MDHPGVKYPSSETIPELPLRILRVVGGGLTTAVLTLGLVVAIARGVEAEPWLARSSSGSWQERMWGGIVPSPTEEGCGWSAWQTFAAALGCDDSRIRAALDTGFSIEKRASLADLYQLTLKAQLPALPFRFTFTGLQDYLCEQRQPILLQVLTPTPHFVVAVPWTKEQALVADPAQGWVSEPVGTLASRASGAALVPLGSMGEPQSTWQQGLASFSAWARRTREYLARHKWHWELGMRLQEAQESWQGLVLESPGVWQPVRVYGWAQQVATVGQLVWQSPRGWWAQVEVALPVWQRATQCWQQPGRQDCVLGADVEAAQIRWQAGYQWSSSLASLRKPSPLPADTRRWELAIGWQPKVAGAPGGEEWQGVVGFTQADEPAIWRAGADVALPSGAPARIALTAGLDLVLTPHLAVGVFGRCPLGSTPAGPRLTFGLRGTWWGDSGTGRFLQVSVGEGFAVQWGWVGDGDSV